MADKYRSDVINFQKYVIGKEFYCFDTETTGLSAAENDIIEFSAIKYRGNEDGTYVQIDELDLFMNPGYEIPEIITELTGITNEKVKDAPSLKEGAEIIRQFLGDEPLLIGYNSVSFDAAFMNALYNKYLGIPFKAKLHLDVLKMAREKCPKPHKLINMAELCGIAEGLSFHTSIDDARATFGVFNYILPMYQVEEEKPMLSDFRITGISRWKKSETLDRIYVNNSMRASVYYDIVNEAWEIGNNLPDEDVIKAAFDYKNVNNIDEFILSVS